MSRNHNSSGLKTEPGILSVDGLVAGKRALNTFPSFHGGGLGQYLFYAIPFGTVMNVPTSLGIVTADGLVEALKQMPSDVAFVVPSVVADLAQNPAALDYVADNVELLLYMGGDLPQAQGEVVASRIPLQCRWGGSEVGLPQRIIPKELDRTKDWKYICLHPETNPTFSKVKDGFYELSFDRNQEQVGDSVQVTFGIRGFEQFNEYRTKDLFEPHPTVPDCWRWRARLDDIIVFLNGEKTNPISMEQHVTARNPELSGVLVVGAQRFQAAMLIDPKIPATTTAEQAALIERVWPSIKEANCEAPAHARVEKSFVLVTSPGRPLPRAGKGTLVRAPGIAQYEAEIDKLYANAEHVVEDEEAELAAVNLGDPNAVVRYIQDAVRELTGKDAGGGSFFDQGMDSLQALQLTRTLRHGLHRPDVDMPTIYKHPTAASLAGALLCHDKQTASDDRALVDSLLSTYGDLVKELRKRKYVSMSNGTGAPAKQDVLLTGSTGALGSFLLHSLLKRADVGHIFCLNRAPDGGQEVQLKRFASMGISHPDLRDRVTFLHANVSKPRLGLEESVYSTVQTSISHIIHNAWPVNFNLNLQAFRPQLAGIVNLFALAADASHLVHTTFISSIGAIINSRPESRPVPETLLDNADVAAPSGYARSKFIAEHLCDTAARSLNTPARILRLGQVAGAVTVSGEGAIWNRHEWFPSLVASSAHLGCVPNSLGPVFDGVDWVPLDVLGDAVLGIAFAPPNDTSNGAGVFQVRNPNVVPWAKLLPAVQTAAKEASGKSMDAVEPVVWLSRLKDTMAGARTAETAAVKANPAVKLLDFYEHMVWGEGGGSTGELMAVDKAVLASKTLQVMSPVTEQWVMKWVSEWLAT
jgi:nucleoside-diphosphate-sugar epimerase/aryl carrier-like protein